MGPRKAPGGEHYTMASDNEIKATVVEKMHNGGYYRPRGVTIDVAAQFGIASHDRGRAKALIEEMANDDASPVHYKVVGEAVMLEDAPSKVAAWIRRHGGEAAVPWDLQSEL